MGQQLIGQMPVFADGGRERICTECGATFTMDEFRCWRWVAESDICVSCDGKAVREMLNVRYGIDLEGGDE